MATTLQSLIEEMERIRVEEMSLIQVAETSEQLEEIRRNIFGKKGRLSTLMRGMGQLSGEERPEAGKAANAVKTALADAIEERSEEIKKQELKAAIEAETIDITLPGIQPQTGALHPLTQTFREIENIFISMGFTVETGPEIEDDYHNFEALNFPHDHPARDSHDTFYLASDLLLRTHTSPVQIHTMKSRKPPMAVIAPGKCYRCDADATHSPMFHQIEGFVVDKGIRFSDLKGTLEAFNKRVFGPETESRFRPHFFPFTEPSAEVDVYFDRKLASGKMVREPLEILGAGMIHPNVLENCGISPEEYSGFAFGMGVDRIAMLKYGIHSIASLFENDARFLKQFR
ncbi:MAG: phenylalanine--tRNA ligase subunit alpha [Candidatus Sumerlaeota bacterium]